MEQLIIKLKAELQKTLPGQDSQYRMAPLSRGRTDLGTLDPASYKLSAVMILFCRDASNNWYLPLTQRFSYAGAHSGQISLPGGKFDAEDLNLQNTAIRECYEEIGLREDIEIVGSLTRLYIPVSGYIVAPFVGVCKVKDPKFVLQQREVKNIVLFNVKDLLNENTVKNGTIVLEGNSNLKIETIYFEVNENKIWGATAMILNELKDLIRPIF